MICWIEEPRKNLRRLVGRYKVRDVAWAVVAVAVAGALWGLLVALMRAN